MNVAPVVVKDPKQLLVTKVKRWAYSVGVVTFIFGLFLIFWKPNWRWGSIGAFLAFITILLLLLRDLLLDLTSTSDQSKMVGSRLAWRTTGAVVYAIALPIIVLAGLYQFMGDTRGDELSWTDPVTNELQINDKNLNSFRDTTVARLSGIDSYLTTLWHTDLLVVNCDTKRDVACVCPKEPIEYFPVPDNKGIWDLNAGVAAPETHGIRLCYRKVAYPVRIKAPGEEPSKG